MRIIGMLCLQCSLLDVFSSGSFLRCEPVSFTQAYYFAGVEAAKVYLREHGVTEDEMEDMVFRKSVGTCFRCGDPLFLSDIPEYTCQCFRCDEDFYSIEQDVDL